MDFIAKFFCYTLTCFCWRSQRGQITTLLDSEHRNYNFPEELVVNILLRLPLKDILRFKVVCKSWLKLISCPYFTSNYVRNSPFTLILRAQYNRINLKKKLLLSFSLLEFAGGGGEHTHHNIPLLTPKLRANSRLSLIGGGSCDGSVFILHTKHFNPPPFFLKRTRQRVYLFNPVSGSCVKVVSDDINRVKPWWVYKVGFIPSNNTYKLVRFNQVLFFLYNPEIFTVGLDEKWRKLDDFGRLHCVGGASGVICFNGAYHWLSYFETDADKISTFHLLEEKTTSGIPLPRGVSRRLKSRCQLTILKDSLSVAERSAEDSSTMVIWTMSEYGVAASWSRFIVVALGGPADQEILMRKDRDLVPIAVLANGGDILFAHTIHGGMCLYNLQHKRLTHTFDSPPDDPSAKYWVDYDNAYVPAFHSS